MKETSLYETEDREHQAVPRTTYGFDLARRDFFKLMGAGVLVGLSLRSGATQESGRRPQSSEEQLPTSLAAWLHVGGDGMVTVFTGKAELGQNIRTSLSQQIAEELRVPLSRVLLVMADTDLTPYDRGTFGSRTTPTMGPQLRRVAATAREVLAAMAAERWHLKPASLVARDGAFLNPHSKQSISYAELSKGQELVKILVEEVKLSPASDWSIAGTPVPKIDGRAFVTGHHRYTSDMTRPGMLHGKVLRPTAFRANLVSVDTRAAEEMPGVTVVRDGNLVAAAAADESVAARAIGAIKAQWNAPPQISESELFEFLKKKPDLPPRTIVDPPQTVGSLDEGYRSAAKTLAQTYRVAYIAHVPLEPRAALAEWKDEKLTVWTGTQRPFAVRDELAQAFRVPSDKVRVIVPDTGSAYGGKHTGDAAIEAARLAKASGKPVKIVWTREEEFTWAYFRPSGVIDVKSGVTAGGLITAWEFDNYNSGPAAIGTPYNIPNQRIAYHPVDPPLRQGSYRGLAAPANHFAREVHMDELAHLVGMDPLEFRLKNLNDPRLRAVFQAAANRFGWGKEKPSSIRGFGIGGGFEKGGYVATCAEIGIQDGMISVRRVAQAFECGTIVNPQGLDNQITGAIVQAIGGALFEAIHFDNGKILNPHLAEYRVPRFSDLPKIEVEMINRKDLPSAGAGETPMMGIAPAISNAIFNATGIRLRSLPMAPDGLPPAAPVKS
jgi:isoquinoline 1-oxidoreductase